MIKDKWIFQIRSDVHTPWALLVVKEYEPTCNFDDVIIDITFYSEDIGADDDNMISFVNWQFATISEYVHMIERIIKNFGGHFDMHDRHEVEHELCDLFFSR